MNKKDRRLKTKDRSAADIFIVPFFIVLFLGFCQTAYSQPTVKQKKEQLQSQMQKLQNEIKNIELAIKNTSAKKQKSMSEILSLQAMIKSREKLIGNINGQIGNLEETITKTEQDIEIKTGEVDKMKLEYASMLRKTYQNTTLQNQLAFLFSSSSFFEAARRYNYLTKVAEYRRGQAKALQQNIIELQEKKETLQTTKDKKVNLLEKQTEQKEKLEEEKKEKDDAVAKLQDKEKKLRRQVDEKNKAAKQLNNRIQAVIEDEIRQARKKAEEHAKKNPSSTTASKKSDAMPMTPQEQLVSKNFSANMGKLPWPVAKGHIVSQFGKHEHPVLKNVIIENNGIDIKTEEGADARAVFGGTVASIFFLPTYQNSILIKHGDFFTLYSNIEQVNVKPNDVISVKQSLGKIHTDKTENLTKVHIEIWKGKDKMDPAAWLAD